MKVNVMLDLKPDQVEVLVQRAIIDGYRRENPSKTWNDNERKDAVRWAVQRRVDLILQAGINPI